MARFTDQVVIVTGATSGIGRATALAFARDGARVVAAGRRLIEGQALVQEIVQAGGVAHFVQTDVSQEDQVKRLVDEALSKFGRLDAAFNNAGAEGLKFVQTPEQTVENFHVVMNSNALGVLLCMKYQIPAMLKSGGGAIVNAASVGATVGMAGMGVYAASKHAVLGLTRSAALEFAKQGVRVNAVSPGIVETEMFDRFAELGSTLEMVAGLHPMGRVGKVEEIAEAVLFLCSRESGFVTGTNLAVDGGWTAQ